nr:AMP-binding protein [Cellvibrionaceae bacterium]
EASIWSNEYIVQDVHPQWRSIPYGFPLSSQRYRVVDAVGRDCPDWVPGELWIGGVGVAMGYCNNPEQTRAQFIEDQGERWYRTGDMGCYWPNGMLEFLGRKDNQIKVGGYRIELGEVDAGIQRVSGVKEGIALAIGDRDKQLVSCIVLEHAEIEAAAQLYQQQQADAALPKNYACLFNTAERHLGKEKRIQQQNTQDIQCASAIALKHFFVSHFTNFGLSLDKKPEVLANSYSVCEQYRPLFYRWLDFIEQSPSNPIDVVPKKSIALIEKFCQHHDTLADIMRGCIPPEALLDTSLSPEKLLFDEVDNFSDQQALIEAIKSLSVTLKRPVKLVEYGCRSGLHGERLVALLSSIHVQYLGLEYSQTLVQQAKKRLLGFDYADVERCQQNVLEQWQYKADIVLINNRLHVDLGDEKSTETILQEAMAIAAPGAMVMVLEVANKSPLTLISADLFTPLTSQMDGERVFRSQQQWLELFNHCQLGLDCHWCSQNHLAFILRQQSLLVMPDHNAVLNALQQQLPHYMVPRRLMFLDALPLTPNGKIDRRTLLSRVNEPAREKDSAIAEDNNAQTHVSTRFLTTEEQAVATVWQQLLDANKLNRHSDFFQLGGDSLAATRCIGALKDQGYRGDLGQLFAKPCLYQFAATLTKQSASKQETFTLIHDTENRYQPFPLTDVQQAYWIGRQPGFTLTGVGAHFFIEFSVDTLDLGRFDRVWNELIQRHEMLRVVVRDHQQQILPRVPRFSTRVYSVDDINGDAAKCIRERQAHQVLDPACWPVFDVQVLHDSQDQYRLLISLDNMLLDGLSMQILLNELQMLYQDFEAALPSITISFRDYVLSHQLKRENSASQYNLQQEKAKRYWQKQVETLPPAPALPLQQAPEGVQHPRFIRMAAHLDVQQWQALKQLAQQYHITPSNLLVGAYAAVLSQWSQQSELTVNLTLFDRQPVHDGIHYLLGDFTSLLLVPWKTENSWLESVKQLQQKIVAGLQYSQVSAVWVMRELAQRQQQAEAAMPVVFTSALGTGSHNFLSQKSWLKPVGGISQTPQVWLDHQVYEADGKLHFNWDAVEALLPQALLAQIFKDYCDLLATLARQESTWLLTITELIPPVHQRPEAFEFVKADRERLVEPPLITHPINTSSSKLIDQRHLYRDIEKYFQAITGLNIHPEQNFFDAGANSLHLVQLHIALQKANFEQLQVTDVFAFPSPVALSDYLLSKNVVDQNVPPDTDNTAKNNQSTEANNNLLSGERLTRTHRKQRRQRRQQLSEPAD